MWTSSENSEEFTYRIMRSDLGPMPSISVDESDSFALRGPSDYLNNVKIGIIQKVGG
jgi:hypothetical protein